MSKKMADPKVRLFMEFFSKEMGAKFVDVDTGEEIAWDGFGEDDETNK